MKLKTEKCKTQNANWIDAIYAARDRRCRAQPFFIFHFSFFILQFPLCIAVCSLAAAADSPSPVQPSTHDALRESLDSHAGDNYDRALLGETNKADASRKDPSNGDLEKKLKQQLGPAAQREDQPRQPLLEAAKGMRDVRARLAQGKSDAITQHVQRQVVADLRKDHRRGEEVGQVPRPELHARRQPVIGQARRRAKRRAEPQPRPATGRAGDSDPNALHGPQQAQSGEQQRAVELMRKYKLQLQARRPDMKLELPSDHFLPEYEGEIEDYFRRLSSGTAAEER